MIDFDQKQNETFSIFLLFLLYKHYPKGRWKKWKTFNDQSLFIFLVYATDEVFLIFFSFIGLWFFTSRF